MKRPSRKSVSTGIEILSAVSLVAGVVVIAGAGFGLLAAGVLGALFGVALDPPGGVK